MIAGARVLSNRLLYQNRIVLNALDTLYYLRAVLLRALEQNVRVVLDFHLEASQVLPHEVALKRAAHLLLLAFQYVAFAHVVHVAYVLPRLAQPVNPERRIYSVFVVELLLELVNVGRHILVHLE